MANTRHKEMTVSMLAFLTGRHIYEARSVLNVCLVVDVARGYNLGSSRNP